MNRDELKGTTVSTFFFQQFSFLKFEGYILLTNSINLMLESTGGWKKGQHCKFVNCHFATSWKLFILSKKALLLENKLSNGLETFLLQGMLT
jgi:hypothetical protein